MIEPTGMKADIGMGLKMWSIFLWQIWEMFDNYFHTTSPHPLDEHSRPKMSKLSFSHYNYKLELNLYCYFSGLRETLEILDEANESEKFVIFCLEILKFLAKYFQVSRLHNNNESQYFENRNLRYLQSSWCQKICKVSYFPRFVRRFVVFFCYIFVAANFSSRYVRTKSFVINFHIEQGTWNVNSRSRDEMEH